MSEQQQQRQLTASVDMLDATVNDFLSSHAGGAGFSHKKTPSWIADSSMGSLSPLPKRPVGEGGDEQAADACSRPPRQDTEEGDERRRFVSGMSVATGAGLFSPLPHHNSDDGNVALSNNCANDGQGHWASTAATTTANGTRTTRRSSGTQQERWEGEVALPEASPKPRTPSPAGTIAGADEVAGALQVATAKGQSEKENRPPPIAVPTGGDAKGDGGSYGGEGGIVLSAQPTDMWGSPDLRTPQTTLAFRGDGGQGKATHHHQGSRGECPGTKGGDEEGEDEGSFASPVPRNPAAVTPLCRPEDATSLSYRHSSGGSVAGDGTTTNNNDKDEKARCSASSPVPRVVVPSFAVSDHVDPLSREAAVVDTAGHSHEDDGNNNNEHFGDAVVSSSVSGQGRWREHAPSRCPHDDDSSSRCAGGEQSFIFVDNGDGTGVLADATLRLDGSCVLGQTVLLAQSLRRHESGSAHRSGGGGGVSPVAVPPPQEPMPHQQRRHQYETGEAEEAEEKEARGGEEGGYVDGSFNSSFSAILSSQPARVARLLIRGSGSNNAKEMSSRRSAAPSRCQDDGASSVQQFLASYHHHQYGNSFSPSVSQFLRRSQKTPSIWLERSVSNASRSHGYSSPSPVPVRPAVAAAAREEEASLPFDASASPVPNQPSQSLAGKEEEERERRAPSPPRGVDGKYPFPNPADHPSAASSVMVVMPDAMMMTPDDLAMQGWVPIRLDATRNTFSTDPPQCSDAIRKSTNGVSAYNSPDFRRRPSDREYHVHGCGACSPLPRDPEAPGTRNAEAAAPVGHPSTVSPSRAECWGEASSVVVEREGSPARLDASSLFSASTLHSINRRLNLSVSLPRQRLSRAHNNDSNNINAASPPGSVADGARLLPTPQTPTNAVRTKADDDNNNNNNNAEEVAAPQWDIATPMGSVNLANFANVTNVGVDGLGETILAGSHTGIRKNASTHANCWNTQRGPLTSAPSPMPLPPPYDGTATPVQRESSPSRCSNTTTQSEADNRGENSRVGPLPSGHVNMAESDLLTSMSFQRPSTVSATSFLASGRGGGGGGGGGGCVHGAAGEASLPISSSSFSTSVNLLGSNNPTTNNIANYTMPAGLPLRGGDLFTPQSHAAVVAPAPAHGDAASQRKTGNSQEMRKTVVSQRTAVSAAKPKTTVAGYYRQQQQQQQQQAHGQAPGSRRDSGASMALYSVNASSFTCSTNTATNETTATTGSSNNHMHRSFQTTYCKRATVAATMGSQGLPLTRGQLGSGVARRPVTAMARGNSSGHPKSSNHQDPATEAIAATYTGGVSHREREELKSNDDNNKDDEQVAHHEHRVEAAAAAIAASARFAGSAKTAASSGEEESASSASTWSITDDPRSGTDAKKRTNHDAGAAAADPPQDSVPREKKRVLSALEHRVSLPVRRVTTEQPDTSVFLPWSPLTVEPDSWVTVSTTENSDLNNNNNSNSNGTSPTPAKPGSGTRKSRKAPMSAQAMAALTNMMALAHEEGETHQSAERKDSSSSSDSDADNAAEEEEGSVDLIASYLFQQAALAMARSGAPSRAPMASSFSLMASSASFLRTRQHQQQQPHQPGNGFPHSGDGIDAGVESLRRLEDDFALSLAATINAYQSLIQHEEEGTRGCAGAEEEPHPPPQPAAEGKENASHQHRATLTAAGGIYTMKKPATATSSQSPPTGQQQQQRQPSLSHRANSNTREQ